MRVKKLLIWEIKYRMASVLFRGFLKVSDCTIFNHFYLVITICDHLSSGRNLRLQVFFTTFHLESIPIGQSLPDQLIELHVTDTFFSQESLFLSEILLYGHPFWDYFINWNTILFIVGIQIFVYTLYIFTHNHPLF